MTANFQQLEKIRVCTPLSYQQLRVYKVGNNNYEHKKLSRVTALRNLSHYLIANTIQSSGQSRYQNQ